MKHTLLATVAAGALVLGASAFAQTSSTGNSSGAVRPPASSSPGASEQAPGQSRPAAGSESSGRSSTAPGQSQNRPSASSEEPGKSETAPGRNRSAADSATPGKSESAPGQGQRLKPNDNSAASTGSTDTSGKAAEKNGAASGKSQASDEEMRKSSSGSSAQRQGGTQKDGAAAATSTEEQGKAGRTATQNRTGTQQGTSATGESRTGAQPNGTAATGTSSTTQSRTGTQQNGASTTESRTGESTTTGTASTSAAISNLDTGKRTEVTRAFETGRVNTATNVNIDVNVGTTLRDNVRLAPLPAEVVRVVPQYRGYDYVVVRDEIVIVEPRTKRVVEVISKSGGTARKSASVHLNAEQRRKFKTSIETTGSTRSTTTTTTRMDLREGEILPDDVTLLDVPDTLVTEVPELRTYRYVVMGNEIGLVEPGTRRVIEVIQE